MTKAERVQRARRVREHLGQFVRLQSRANQEFVTREWGTNPEYAAFNRLLSAGRELDSLIAELRAEGYGQ